MTMYSEHIIATLLTFAGLEYPNGGDLDAHLTRRVVQIGRIIGLDLGCVPSDAGLTWHTRTYGTVTGVGGRGAIHLLPDGRTAMGLGSGRGLIETRGDRLVIVRAVDPTRYTAAYRLPNIEYGGLI